MSYSSSIFEAADNTTAMWGWRPDVPSTAAETRESHENAVGRAHNLWQNDAIIRAIVNRQVERTVGTGLRLESRPEKAVIGLTDDQIREWTRKTEAKFRLYLESAQLDLAGTRTDMELSTLLLTNVLVHGDSGIRFVRRKNKAGEMELKVQIIDGRRFNTPLDKITDPDIIGGVEVDPVTTAPTAYYIDTAKPNDLVKVIKNIGKPERFERFEKGKLATDLVFLPNRPNQYRGLSTLIPIVETGKKLHDLISACVRGEQVRATVSFVIQAADDTQDIKELDGNVQLTEQTGPSAHDYYGGSNVVLAEGKVLKLRKDDKIFPLQNPHANDVLKDLADFLIMIMGAACGVPKEILTQSYTTSFTSARAAQLDFDANTKRQRKYLENWFYRRVYEAWLEIEIAKGAIDAPGFFLDAAIRNAWLACEFRGDNMGHIDPTKMVQFYLPMVKNGLCSIERMLSEVFGVDFTTEEEQIAAERKKLDADGMSDIYKSDVQHQQSSQNPDNNQNKQDEGE